MGQSKFFVGLGAGLVMGIALMNLQPLSASDKDSMGALLNEVRQLKADVKTIAASSTGLTSAVKAMASDVKELNARSNISPKLPNN